MKNEIRTKNCEDIYFKVNIRAADELEKRINEMFYNNELRIDGLDHETAYKEDISPFKKLLSNKFAQYEFKDETKDELELFKKMILKSQVIFTTNYKL